MVRLSSLGHWCAALLFFGQSAFAQPDGQVFTDWRVLCQSAEETMTTCQMLQSASASEDGSTVFLLSISPGGNAGANYAVVTVPTGVYLAPALKSAWIAAARSKCSMKFATGPGVMPGSNYRVLC